MACGNTTSGVSAISPCNPCGLKFGCKGDRDLKQLPPAMAFRASIAGSCPGGAVLVQEGNMSYQGPPDHGPSNCGPGDGGATCTNLCGCGYNWNYLDDPDFVVPDCGAWIANVGFGCLCIPGFNGLLYACDHFLSKVDNWNLQCFWVGTITVYRVGALIESGPPCLGFIDDMEVSHPNCPRQDCDTCSWIYDDPERDHHICCCTCPQCSHECNAPCGGGTETLTACPAPDPPPVGFCCDDGDCAGEYQPFTCHVDGVEVNCGPAPAAGCAQSCGDRIYTSRQYTFMFAGCLDADKDARGYNPLAGCAGTAKDWGDNYLKMQHWPRFSDDQSTFIGAEPNCLGDWLEVGCPGSIPALSIAQKRLLISNARGTIVRPAKGSAAAPKPCGSCGKKGPVPVRR